MNISKVGIKTARTIALAGLIACAASCATPCNCKNADTCDSFEKEKQKKDVVAKNFNKTDVLLTAGKLQH